MLLGHSVSMRFELVGNQSDACDGPSPQAKDTSWVTSGFSAQVSALSFSGARVKSAQANRIVQQATPATRLRSTMARAARRLLPAAPTRRPRARATAGRSAVVSRAAERRERVIGPQATAVQARATGVAPERAASRKSRR